MLGIDTNVLIRLLVSDDAEQTRRARKLVDQAVSRDEPVLVSLPVLGSVTAMDCKRHSPLAMRGR